MQNTTQFAYELQKAGKQFDLMLYPGTRHGVANPPQVKHLYQMITDFVLKNLEFWAESGLDNFFSMASRKFNCANIYFVMSTILNTHEKTVRKDKAGIRRVGDSRVSLDSVIFAFNEGATAEEIVLRFPTINLKQAYSAISFYLQNTAKVEAYLAGRAEKRAALQIGLEEKFSPKGIRQRLLSRGKNSK